MDTPSAPKVSVREISGRRNDRPARCPTGVKVGGGGGMSRPCVRAWVVDGRQPRTSPRTTRPHVRTCAGSLSQSSQNASGHLGPSSCHACGAERSGVAAGAGLHSKRECWMESAVRPSRWDPTNSDPCLRFNSRAPSASTRAPERSRNGARQLGPPQSPPAPCPPTQTRPAAWGRRRATAPRR